MAEEEIEVKEEKIEGLTSKQTKISIEIKISKNYNTITLGIQDEPLNSSTEEEFRNEIKRVAAILREEAEVQLKLITPK